MDNKLRFFPMYDSHIAENITAHGKHYLNTVLENTDSLADDLFKDLPVKKVYYIRYKNNGIPIDKVLRVTENSPLYKKLVDTGYNFKNGTCWLEDTDTDTDINSKKI